MRQQSLEVTDSTGHVLEPAVFDLARMSSRRTEKGTDLVFIRGEGPNRPFPEQNGCISRVLLRVPVAVVQDSPVYELPLRKKAELQIPVPGMSGSGGGGHDVAASGDVPVCRLKLEGVKEQGNGDLHAQVSLQVEGVPFDLECFEVVDDKGFPLKNAVSASGGASMGPLGQERFWHQRFKFKGGADTERLHVRLKYRADAETVACPWIAPSARRSVIIENILFLSAYNFYNKLSYAFTIMKIPALLLSVATGFSGLGSLSPGEEISPPPLRLELKQMVLKGKNAARRIVRKVGTYCWDGWCRRHQVGRFIAAMMNRSV